MHTIQRWIFGFAFLLLLSGVVQGSLASELSTGQAQTTDPVLVGAGDIVKCIRTEHQETAKLLDSIDGTVFTLGDNAYPDGTLAQFNDCYGPTWGRHKDRTRPSPGNHDYHVAGAAGYFTYFGAAASPLDTDCTSDCKGYYSYDLGYWHIIVLNSEIPHEVGSTQELWLRGDLEANQSTCTLAYWHKPRFSSGQHGNMIGIAPFWQALYDFEADVVLNGHDHTYERFDLQNPSGQADPNRGIREFVVGTGGAALYPFPTIQPNSQVRNNTAWGVLKLTLHATSYSWEFIPIAGQTFTDSGSANCVTTSPPPVTYTLTVNKTGIGSGTVTSNPAGIDCGSDCSEAYAPNTSVTLTAAPDPGST
ncbi:MAG TPA: metallophosphoesterase, partial [Anaerolineales bacterium]|nr:metallophosphoesterase [Anaerolineales bacterium]